MSATNEQLLGGTDAERSDRKPVRVLCFARVPSPTLFSIIEFYREDLEIFRELGYEVQAENRYRSALVSDADILYAWWGATSLPVVLAWRLLGRKTVLTGAVAFSDRSWPGRGSPPAWFRARRRLRKILTLLASRLASCTVAVSGVEREELRQAGVRQVELAYHSVDEGFYQPGTRDEQPYAITVGQCNHRSILRKGIDLCVESTSMVRRAVPGYRLVIVGPLAADGEEWFAQARSQFDFSGIEIRGEVSREEKRSLLQGAWVYLQPSVHEAFGVAVVEAMDCGTVPICSSNGALAEVVGAGGVVLGERTAEQLAEQVVDLIRDDERRHDLSRRARDRALTFSRASRRQRLGQIVADVLAR